MKFASLFLGLATLIVFMPTTCLGCSCAENPPLLPGESVEDRRAVKRKYFASEFAGSAFVGKITDRQAVFLNDHPYYRYTIKVSEYWLGISSPTVIVYSEPDHRFPSTSFGYTSCGFRLDRGKTFFFTPSKNDQSVFEIHQCDYAGGAGALDGYKLAEFRIIMGASKRFERK